jgi:hypothetical protein
MTEHNLPDKDNAPWLDCMDGFKTLSSKKDCCQLSPAAQAVLNASKGAKYDDQLVADILKAAADQLTPYTVSEMDGAAFARNKLLAIAAEIKAQ